MKYQIYAIIISLILLISSQLAAQNVTDFTLFEEVPISNSQLGDIQPLLSFPYQTLHTAFSYSHELNKFFFLYDNTLVEIDLTNKDWFKTEMDSIPLEELHFGYSDYHKNLLFWDAGVGRVFELDSTYTFVRLDNSYNQKTQFLHFPWIESSSGSLYVLGGYGLFEPKNHLVRFRLSSGVWELIEYDDPLNAPKFIQAGTGFYDYVNQLVYVITDDISVEEFYSGKSVSGKATLWRYSILNKSWSMLYTFDDYQQSWRRNSSTELFKSKHINLPVIMIPSEFGNNAEATVCFFHTEKKFLKCLDTPQKQLFYNFDVKNMFWSNHDQAYYLVGSQSQVANEAFFVKVVKLTITDEQAFMKWMEKEDSPWYMASGLWLMIGVLSTGFALFGVLYRNRNRVDLDVWQMENPRSISISINENGEHQIVGQKRTIDDLPVVEQKLLSLLVDSFRQPGNYLKSDEIDSVLLPNHPSQDYIRRIRNLTFERLEEMFQSAGDASVSYIVRRPTRADKRKNEYRLNEKYVKVGSG